MRSEINCCFLLRKHIGAKQAKTSFASQLLIDMDLFCSIRLVKNVVVQALQTWSCFIYTSVYRAAEWFELNCDVYFKECLSVTAAYGCCGWVLRNPSLQWHNPCPIISQWTMMIQIWDTHLHTHSSSSKHMLWVQLCSYINNKMKAALINVPFNPLSPHIPSCSCSEKEASFHFMTRGK